MALRAASRPVRLFVRSPRTFFREYSATKRLDVGFVLVLVLATVLAGSVVASGAVLAGSLDETVTVDNPDRPPAWACDGPASDGGGSSFDEGCDEPATIERDAGELVQEAATEYVSTAFVAPFSLWAIAGVTLFAGARLAGGEGRFAETLAAAAWGAVPELVRIAAALVGFRYVLGRTSFSGPVESYPEQLASALAVLDAPLLVVGLGVLAWQWVVLAAAVEEIHDVSRTAAGTVVGAPLAVWALLFALQ